MRAEGAPWATLNCAFSLTFGVFVIPTKIYLRELRDLSERHKLTELSCCTNCERALSGLREAELTERRT